MIKIKKIYYPLIIFECKVATAIKLIINFIFIVKLLKQGIGKETENVIQFEL